MDRDSTYHCHTNPKSSVWPKAGSAYHGPIGKLGLRLASCHIKHPGRMLERRPCCMISTQYGPLSLALGPQRNHKKSFCRRGMCCRLSRPIMNLNIMIVSNSQQKPRRRTICKGSMAIIPVGLRSMDFRRIVPHGALLSSNPDQWPDFVQFVLSLSSITFLTGRDNITVTHSPPRRRLMVSGTISRWLELACSCTPYSERYGTHTEYICTYIRTSYQYVHLRQTGCQRALPPAPQSSRNYWRTPVTY